MSTLWSPDEYRYVGVRLEFETRDGRRLITETGFRWPHLSPETLEALAETLGNAVTLAEQCRTDSSAGEPRA